MSVNRSRSSSRDRRGFTAQSIVACSTKPIQPRTAVSNLALPATQRRERRVLEERVEHAAAHALDHLGDLGIAADAAAHERDERARVTRDVIEVRVEAGACALDRREIAGDRR